MYDIAVHQKFRNGNSSFVAIETLSVSTDGQLLVGQWSDLNLHAYAKNGSHVTSISIPSGFSADDAVWTPRGNISFVTGKEVVTVTQAGNVIAQATLSSSIALLSVSNDRTIYLSDYSNGLYQSTDDV